MQHGRGQATFQFPRVFRTRTPPERQYSYSYSMSITIEKECHFIEYETEVKSLGGNGKANAVRLTFISSNDRRRSLAIRIYGNTRLAGLHVAWQQVHEIED